jgi:hypothetical protein
MSAGGWDMNDGKYRGKKQPCERGKDCPYQHEYQHCQGLRSHAKWLFMYRSWVCNQWRSYIPRLTAPAAGRVFAPFLVCHRKGSGKASHRGQSVVRPWFSLGRRRARRRRSRGRRKRAQAQVDGKWQQQLVAGEAQSCSRCRHATS